MKSVNFKKEMPGSVEQCIPKVEVALKEQGFGVLTRIDFHTKMKEKLGKDLPPTVILGACNPSLAFEAFQRNKDVTSLLPCNVVVREVKPGVVSVEAAKPTAMMEALGDRELVSLAADADQKILKALDSLN